MEKFGEIKNLLNKSESMRVEKERKPSPSLTKSKAIDLIKAVDRARKSIMKQNPKDGRPPKKWFDDCVSAVSGKADDPGALCGWVWYHHKKK